MMALVHAFENQLLELLNWLCFPVGSFDDTFLMLVFGEEVVIVNALGNKAMPDKDDGR